MGFLSFEGIKMVFPSFKMMRIINDSFILFSCLDGSNKNLVTQAAVSVLNVGFSGVLKANV